MTNPSFPAPMTYTEEVQPSKKPDKSEQKKQKKQKEQKKQKKVKAKPRKRRYLQGAIDFLKTRFMPNIMRYWKSFVASIQTLTEKSYQYLRGVFNKYPNFKSKRSITFGILISILLITAFVFIFQHHSGPNPETNLARINQVQTELTRIQTTVKNTSQMNVVERRRLARRLMAINSKLNTIFRQNGQNMQRLQINLKSTTTELSKKVAALNHQIHQIKTKIFPAPTLNASVLPFKVISIDPWNGAPYAEVVQRHNSTMVSYVGLSQSIGGWKVVDMSVPEQSVTLMNRHKQVVHIQLKSF